MKQQKVQALTSAEVSEILALQKVRSIRSAMPARLTARLCKLTVSELTISPNLMLWWCSAVIRGLSSMPGKSL